MKNLLNKKILFIICGGISAYKSLETIRLFRKSGAEIKTILTASAKEFVTPLSITALSQGKVYSELFSCLLYTSPSPRDSVVSRMPSSA